MQTLQSLLDSLSHKLRCAVSLDDKPLGTMFHSSIHGQLDQARITRMLSPRRGPDPKVRAYVRSWVCEGRLEEYPVRIPPNVEIGVGSRVYAPIRLQGDVVGHLFAFDPDMRLGEADFAVIRATAEVAALIIHRELLLWDLERSRERELLKDLLSDDEEVRAQAAQDIEEMGLFPTREPVISIAVSCNKGASGNETTHAGLETAMESLRTNVGVGRIMMLPRRDHCVLLINVHEPTLRYQDVRALIEAFCCELHSSSTGALVGIGDIQPDLDHCSHLLETCT